MKKIAMIVGLFSLALSAVAAVTPTGKLNIALNSAGQEEKVLRLRQHASFSDAFDNTWDAEAVTDGGIYVLYGDDHYTTWASNQFVNLPVGFGAIGDNDYTLTFSNFGGDDISFKDLVTGDEITLSSSTTYPYVYNFSINDSQKNTAINNRFVINPSTTVISVTTGADGWASFAYSDDVVPAYPAGLTIYKGEFNDDLVNPAIALTPVADIPAGAGVFVYGAANTTYYFAATTATVDMTGNDIVGCVAATPVSTFSGKDIYTLRYANGETALWHYTGASDIPAGKAVLPISAGGPYPAPKRISMQINTTQGIEDVQMEAVKVEKFMENGQVFIKRGDAVYTLQGQMVK
jgi:hypothetical protein